ncbi:hypothetical protein B0H11DRAFT_2195596 [Mycena galericulata]|nr:hypothetical protein B0H11DRAFT_2195596 [Mycena galericulata]
MSRQVVIDDTDPSITYSANWFPDTSSNLVGNFGTPYNQTSHSSIVAGSSFTYSFNGTAVVVRGTIDEVEDASGVLNPSWTCLVDGTAITNPSPTFRFPENNWMLCCSFELVPAVHTLEVQTTTTGQPFRLDAIEVTPLPGAKVGPGVVRVWNNDSSVVFGPGWVATNESLSVSASLVGMIPSGLSHLASSATYSIDGGEPTGFTLPGINGDTDSYNTIFFTTPTLQVGTHSLVIENGGNNTRSPLTVDYFFVSTGDNAANTATTSSASSVATDAISSTGVSSSSTTPLSTTAVTSSNHHSNIGAIAGGVVGGILILALLGLGWWYFRSRSAGTGEKPQGGFGHVEPWVQEASVGQARAPGSVTLPARVDEHEFRPWEEGSQVATSAGLLVPSTITTPANRTLFGATSARNYEPDLRPREERQTITSAGLSAPSSNTPFTTPVMRWDTAASGRSPLSSNLASLLSLSSRTDCASATNFGTLYHHTYHNRQVFQPKIAVYANYLRWQNNYALGSI